MEKAYCEYCCRQTEYTTNEEELVGKVNGRYIFYKGKRAYCSRCGNVIYPHEVLNYNVNLVMKGAGNAV